MNLNEFAKEIHENAVAHGWWDEPRPFDELCALMISELSEALEEARAGRPMEWYKRMPGCHPNCADERIDECEEAGGCYFGFGALKPEGIAVEMADCAIRIMDYLGNEGHEICDFNSEPFVEDLSATIMEITSQIVNARLFMRHGYESIALDKFVVALALIVDWFATNNLDFETIARHKHEHNKTRPYKHGKEF